MLSRSFVVRLVPTLRKAINEKDLKIRMADIRRKSVKDFPRINNCRIHPDAFSTLNQIAGHRAMGAAIEELCNMWHLSRKKNASVGDSHARDSQTAAG
jgi:hypothetical protein